MARALYAPCRYHSRLTLLPKAFTMKTISAIVLAGGRATRMQGRDKGLVPWRGQPLIEHVLSAVRPQVDEVVISCNRNAEIYARYAPCRNDDIDGFPGPLAGIAACLPLCRQDWVLVVACDMPCLPTDLAAKLLAGADGLPLAVAHDGEFLQPLALLFHRSLAASLDEALREGVSSVQKWIRRQPHAVVHFEDPAAFININALEELTGNHDSPL